MYDECRSNHYNRETLDVRFKGKNIGQVLNMTVAEGREFFDAIPSIANKLQTLSLSRAYSTANSDHHHLPGHQLVHPEL